MAFVGSFEVLQPGGGALPKVRVQPPAAGLGTPSGVVLRTASQNHG